MPVPSHPPRSSTIHFCFARTHVRFIFRYFQITDACLRLSHVYSDFAHTYLGPSHVYLDLSHVYLDFAHANLDPAHTYLDLAHTYLDFAYAYLDLTHAYIDFAHVYSKPLASSLFCFCDPFRLLLALRFSSAMVYSDNFTGSPA